MKLERAARILEIAASINPDGAICAEHDELYFAQFDAPFSSNQREELKTLGAHCHNDKGWYFFT